VVGLLKVGHLKEICLNRKGGSHLPEEKSQPKILIGARYLYLVLLTIQLSQ